MVTRPANPRERIVVVGGGAGGIELATRLGRRNPGTFDVMLVDRNPSHLWKPRLHEVAAGLLDAGDGAVSYAAQANRAGFMFCLGGLTGLDSMRRVVRLGPVIGPESKEELLGEREIAYDRLVLALGSCVNDFGIPGVREHAHMLDSAAQAARFQRCFFELAVQVAAGRQQPLRVAIVGAGATGVELAAELHHVVHVLGHYPGLDARRRLAITLIDRAPRILSSADPRTSAYALQTIERLGVEVRLNASVAEVMPGSVRLQEGPEVACDIVVWASGVTGTEVVRRLQGLTLGKDGRIAVTPFLACEGVERVYAMGDCAAARDGDGTLAPTAQVARQQALYLSHALGRHGGEAPRPFRYRPMGTLVSLGRDDAAAELPSPRHGGGVHPAQGRLAKVLYVSLYHLHRAGLHGLWRAGALAVADRLRGLSQPPVKLH